MLSVFSSPKFKLPSAVIFPLAWMLPWTFKFSPIVTLFRIPTPPATVKAPSVLLTTESSVDVIRKFASVNAILDETFKSVPAMVTPSPVNITFALLILVLAPVNVTFEEISVLVPPTIVLDVKLETVPSIVTLDVK